MTGWRFRTGTVSSGLVSGGIAKTSKQQNKKKKQNRNKQKTPDLQFFHTQKKQFFKKETVRAPSLGNNKIYRDDKDFILICSVTFRILHITSFWFFPGVLEGLGRSGRLVGTISTYAGTYKCPSSRVMAKNPPGGIFFTEYGMF